MNTSDQSLFLNPQDVTNQVIVAHYHLFKNAGTSVDAILAENFSSDWRKIEFDKIDHQSNSGLVQNWLLAHQSISAFSSHTAMFPLPKIALISVIPIIFLRHPIDRLWSVYKFERKHKKILNESIKLAQKHDFAGYLNYQLDQTQNRSCRNFQTYRFSWLNPQPNLTELEQALHGLDSLSIVGIVEEFDLSMKRYQKAIAQYYPSFEIKSVHKNITSQHNLSLPEKLDLIQSNLDRSTYQRLLDSNRDDLKLYEAAKRKLFDPKATKA
ncbi:MAG: sulfotransferase family 2 domain-containing protein [Pleurocapsa sp.]